MNIDRVSGDIPAGRIAGTSKIESDKTAQGKGRSVSARDHVETSLLAQLSAKSRDDLAEATGPRANILSRKEELLSSVSDEQIDTIFENISRQA